MLKRIAFVGLACVAIGAQAQDSNGGVGPRQRVGAPMLPDGSLVPNDLTLDPAFGGVGSFGMSAFWPLWVGTPTENGLRVFPSIGCSDGPIALCTLTGYYVAGRRKLLSGDWLGIVARRNMDGSLDSTFAGNGWISRASYHELNDFAMLNGRIYFAGSRLVSGLETFVVDCTDLSTAADCSGFASPSENFSTHGATGNAVAERIVADASYGLLVGGYVGTAQGYEIALARFDAATGARISQFRADGLMTSLPSWASTPADVDVYDMTLAPASVAGGARLYVSGTARAAGNYDGFVLALHPGTGAEIAGWWPIRRVYEEGDNTTNKNDAVTAITVQRNGKLAMAGWSGTDTAGERRLMLSRFNVDGSGDNRFCDGAVTCIRNDSSVGVVDDDWPVAIAERASNHDLVVALKHSGSSASDSHTRQTAWQFGSDGNMKHASQLMDYEGTSPAQTSSSAAGMWIGNAGFGGAGPEVIAIIGTRQWQDADLDMTLSHLVSNDSIYADQFGGTNSD